MRPIKYKSIHIAFSICIILGFYNNLVAAEIKIKHVIYNNYIADWSMSKLNRNMIYSALDKDGLPMDLVILFRIKAISFKFTTYDCKRLVFRNRLEGLYKNWTFCDTNRVSTFNNLKPGKYIYCVQGLNQNKIICEKKFHFEISKDNENYIVYDFLWLLLIILIIYTTIKLK